jgi:hypothetical protein
MFGAIRQGRLEATDDCLGALNISKLLEAKIEHLPRSRLKMLRDRFSISNTFRRAEIQQIPALTSARGILLSELSATIRIHTKPIFNGVGASKPDLRLQRE